MPRIANYWAWFLFGFTLWATFGMISRGIPKLIPWFWGFLTLFLLIVVVMATVAGRKAYASQLNTTEAVILSNVVLIGLSALGGAIAAWAA